jgi:hypothetical protein
MAVSNNNLFKLSISTMAQYYGHHLISTAKVLVLIILQVITITVGDAITATEKLIKMSLSETMGANHEKIIQQRMLLFMDRNFKSPAYSQ